MANFQVSLHDINFLNRILYQTYNSKTNIMFYRGLVTGWGPSALFRGKIALCVVHLLLSIHYEKWFHSSATKINHKHILKMLQMVEALWCSGSCYRLVIRGSWVRIPLGAYAPRQGILSTIVSLDPGVVNGYPAGISSLKCTVRH